MKLAIEFLPIVVFFAAYKFYTLMPEPVVQSINAVMPFVLTAGSEADAIYFATLVAIAISGLMILLHLIKHRDFNKNQTITFFLLVIFGGATIFLRDPVFIKWKPSVFNLALAGLFLGSAFIGKKPLTERLLGQTIQVPKSVWLKLNSAWVIFFIFVAVINLYIAYNFSEQMWVNFKVFGLLGLTVAFIILQVVFLSRYIKE